MPDQITRAQFAASIKTKYPVYAKVPDDQLVDRTLEKYPVYRDRVKVNAPTHLYSPDAADFTAGVGQGVLNRVVDLGEAVHAVPGVSRAVDWLYGQPGLSAAAFPEARRMINDVDTGTYGRAGRTVYHAAEYAYPAGRVAQWTRNVPWFGRTMAQAGTSAGVAGVQTGGDPEAMLFAAGMGAVGDTAFRVAGAGVRATRNAAAGARDGGFGGAVAGAIRTTAPLNAKAMLFQAIKPRSTLVNWDRSMNMALPELKAAEAGLGRHINGIDDLIEATKWAKRQIQNELQVIRGTARGFEVDLSPVAEAMERSIPKKLQLENPELALRLQNSAKVYRQRFSLEDAEQLLKETNAEMEAFYSKYPPAQRRALTADPEWARLNAQAKELRQSIDATFDRAADTGGDAARELRRRYGALLDVETESFRRANVAKRQQPESLSEQLSAARAAMEITRGTWRLVRGDLTGAADIVGGVAMRDTARFLKEQQTTDALIRRAFAGYQGARAPVQMPSHRPVRGYLRRGSIVTEPPADVSGGRGVSAWPDVRYSGTPRQLPAPVRPMPAHTASPGRLVEAKPMVVRDPRTGRMRRIYLSEGR